MMTLSHNNTPIILTDEECLRMRTNAEVDGSALASLYPDTYEDHRSYQLMTSLTNKLNEEKSECEISKAEFRYMLACANDMIETHKYNEHDLPQAKVDNEIKEYTSIYNKLAIAS